MNSKPIELISTFRKKIILQTVLLILLLVALAACLWFLYVTRKTPFYTGALILGVAWIVFLIYFSIRRKNQLCRLLNKHEPDTTLSHLEAHYERWYDFFRKRDITRFIAGGVLAAIVLFLLYFFPHSHWTGELTALWLGLILASMLQSWLLMGEGIMIQDLKRSIRDGHSDNS